MLEYFPGVYWPNLLFSNAAASGAPIGDLDDACRSALQVMRSGKSENSPEFKEALIQGFSAVGEKLERLVSQDLAEGRKLSAGDKSFRAAAIWNCLELLMDDFYDPRKIAVFDQARAAFKRAMQYGGAPHDRSQFVSIPFEGKEFDALFTPANSPGRAPIVIHLNGTHSNIEWQYLMGIVGELAKRGIASVSMDHPGSGSARYHKGMKYRPDPESYVGAVIDFISARPDVDPERVGVCGASFGGYFAPRATAFEKRVKACAVWGASLDWNMRWPERIFPEGRPSGALSAAAEATARQQRWAFGANSNEELYDKYLTYVLPMDKVTTPLFIIHGKNDPQTPLWMAEKMLAQAVNSPRAELMVIGPEIGGDMHCNVDNPRTTINALSDWLAEVLNVGGGEGRLS